MAPFGCRHLPKLDRLPEGAEGGGQSGTLVAAFALPNLVTIAATVFTMVGAGFGVARWMRMYPVDLAIINSCRCAQGGTGNVAILTACDRMQLMPFAQVATRIGGLATVFGALMLYAKMH